MQEKETILPTSTPAQALEVAPEDGKDGSPVENEPPLHTEALEDSLYGECQDCTEERIGPAASAEVLAAQESATPLRTVESGFVISKAAMTLCAIAVPICLAAAIGIGVWIGGTRSDPWRVESGLVDYGGFASNVPTSDQIVIPGYGEILLEANTRDVMLILPNPAGNPCYFRFSILLRESGEVIYTSGLVPPGKAIEALRLKKALEAGSYPATIQIETFSLDDSHSPMNGANVEVVLQLR